MSVTVPLPASPKSIFFAPEVCSSPSPSPPPSPSPNPYKIAYDVSLSPSVTLSVKKEETKFDLLDALQSLSTVNRQFEEIAEKMLASSHEETLMCLPMIGQILESCAVLVAIHQHRDEIKADIAKESSAISVPSPDSTSSPSQANNIFINDLTSFIARAAPSGVFSRRKAKRRRAKLMRNCVHPELFSAWYHASQLFSPSKPSSSNTTTSPKPLPTISLKDVNSFAMRNVPKPSLYSVQGCSSDAAFYRTKFARCAPFGSLYGYNTNLGVVPVPDEPVFGHVWDHNAGGWLLNATFVKEEVFIKPKRISRASQRRIERGTRYSTDQQHFL